MSFESPLKIHTQDDHGRYNRTFARNFGIVASVLLGYLVDQYNLFYKNIKLHSDPKHGDGWFYITIDKLEEELGISRKLQDKTLAILEKEGMIEIKVFGVPPKRHFRMNVSAILALHGLQIIPEKLDSNNNDRDKLNCPNGTNCSAPAGHMHPYIYNQSNNQSNINTLSEFAHSDSQSESFFSPSTQHNNDYQDVDLESHTEDIPPDKPSKKKSKSQEDKLSFGSDGLVKLTQKQYDDLLKHMDAKQRDQWIVDVSNAIGAQGERKFNKKYESHYHVILQWKRYRDERNGGKDMSKIAPHRRNSNMVTPGDFDSDDFKFKKWGE